MVRPHNRRYCEYLSTDTDFINAKLCNQDSETGPADYLCERDWRALAQERRVFFWGRAVRVAPRASKPVETGFKQQLRTPILNSQELRMSSWILVFSQRPPRFLMGNLWTNHGPSSFHDRTKKSVRGGQTEWWTELQEYMKLGTKRIHDTWSPKPALWSKACVVVKYR